MKIGKAQYGQEFLAGKARTVAEGTLTEVEPTQTEAALLQS